MPKARTVIANLLDEKAPSKSIERMVTGRSTIPTGVLRGASH